jgi:hypothetical protein
MKNKQTAVEWLNQRRLKNGFNTMEDFQQAKVMMKEQIVDAFGVGCHHESKRLVGYQDTADQYYNETYGGNK